MAFDRFLHQDRLYVLNFHRLSGSSQAPDDPFGTTTGFDSFKSTVDLLSNQFQFVDVYEWSTSSIEERKNGACVAITFDDGHRSVLEFAIPYLVERNIPLTIFVNSAYWGKERRICWSDGEVLDVSVAGRSFVDAVREARRTSDKTLYWELTQKIEAAIYDTNRAGQHFITKDELYNIRHKCVNVGLHGHFHHRHSMQSRSWQNDNILKNLCELKEHPRFTPIFAPPFGTSIDINGDTLDLCRRHGLLPAFHNGGYNVGQVDFIRRIPADGRCVSSIIEAQSPFLTRYDISYD